MDKPGGLSHWKLQLMEIVVTWFHLSQIHFDEVVLDARGFGGGE
jgi:hypothetical protein